MRQRLTLSFVVLSIALLLGAFWAHQYTARDSIRDHESSDLRQDVRVAATLISLRQQVGEPVDQAWLTGLVGLHQHITWRDGNGTTVEAEGTDFDGGGMPLSAGLDVAGGRVDLLESNSVIDDLSQSSPGALAWLLVLVALVAALVGYVMARLLSAPFRQLAVAAGQLGRGRFELDLPRTRIPEARAVSLALMTSAGQLQERLASEQAFAEHASHVLRTPLTGLRLELEELAARSDLPTDVRDTATRSIGRIESMDAVAGELVQLSRRGALVAGAQISLRDLATQCAQTWADALAEQDRALSAAVEGNLQTTYTPGPVEHVLDLLLADVLKRGRGHVRMVFEAFDDGNLKIAISSDDEPRSARGPAADLPVTQARAVIGALGGRLMGDDPRELTILLPRR